MTTRVSFDAATIADAMKRSARVAPGKVGTSFDKAAGIVFDIAPSTDAPCIVRATDTETFYFETLEVISAEGDACRWRLPSQIMSSVIGTMPASSGKTVTFSWDGQGPILISSGRMRVSLNLIKNPHYPDWDVVDATSLVNAPNFGGNITRVEWAASKDSPLNAVMIDGEYMISTDRYRIARVECPINLNGPSVLIPAWSIGQLIKQMGDVLVGSSGNMFIVMPDDFTQIQVVTLGNQFPSLKRVFDIGYDEEVKLNREELLRHINNAVQFAGANRDPLMTIYLGREEVAVHLLNQDIGLFGDVIEVPGQVSGPRTKIHFTPKMLVDALTNAPNNNITFKFNPSNVKLPVCIDGDSGYTAWVAPRTEISSQQ